jgi:hypothetical protein
LAGSTPRGTLRTCVICAGVVEVPLNAGETQSSRRVFAGQTRITARQFHTGLTVAADGISFKAGQALSIRAGLTVLIDQLTWNALSR